MLRQRVISAIFLAALLVAATWAGNHWFTILVAVFALLGVFEFYRLVAHPQGPLIYLGLGFTLLLVLSPLYAQDPRLMPLLVTSAVFFPLGWLILRPEKEKAFVNWVWMLAGMFYVGWMLSYFVALRNMDNGMQWVFLALLPIFASDSSAFLAGRAWGKHLLAKDISPGKTWEGAIAGLLGAIIACLILNIVLPDLNLGYPRAVLLGFLISLFAQLGDLVESLLKRNMGVKDSGKLIPGHGGILDRMDSLVFVGALVYYYALLSSTGWL
jgi:phosphatidate cytidylyltransferase